MRRKTGRKRGYQVVDGEKGRIPWGITVFPQGGLKRCDPKTIEAAHKSNRYK